MASNWHGHKGIGRNWRQNRLTTDANLDANADKEQILGPAEQWSNIKTDQKLTIDVPSITHSQSSPLQIINEELNDFFDCSLRRASLKFASLHQAIRNGKAKTQFSPSDYYTKKARRLADEIDWKSCHQSVKLVLLLAAPERRLLKYGRELLDHHDSPNGNVKNIQSWESENLGAHLLAAKVAAVYSGSPTFTVISVSLNDMEHAERCDEDPRYNQDDSYASFTHAFVLGVGPEGWYLWQSFAACYTLRDWLKRGGARLQHWGELRDWLKHFAVLTRPQVSGETLPLIFWVGS